VTVAVPVAEGQAVHLVSVAVVHVFELLAPEFVQVATFVEPTLE